MKMVAKVEAILGSSHDPGNQIQEQRTLGQVTQGQLTQGQAS